MFDLEVYNIDEYFDKIEEENKTDKISEELQAYMVLEPDREKGEKCCNFVAMKQYENENIDKEIKRLQDLKKHNEKKIDSVKAFLFYLSGKTGITQFNTRKIQVRHSQVVDVDKDINIDNIPEQFLNVKTVKEISKTKIKEFLNEPVYIDQETGEMIPNQLDWARLKENVNITIK